MKDIINARCGWAGTDELYIKYHDEEWGRPVSDDKTLFEFLVLESAQAGLSWLTILRKREGYRRAFHGRQPGLSTTILRAVSATRPSTQNPNRMSSQRR